jgi:hypothetical protein
MKRQCGAKPYLALRALWNVPRFLQRNTLTNNKQRHLLRTPTQNLRYLLKLIGDTAKQVIIFLARDTQRV